MKSSDLPKRRDGLREALLEAEWFIFRSEPIERLDSWLEYWLDKKDHCPCCGTKDRWE